MYRNGAPKDGPAMREDTKAALNLDSELGVMEVISIPGSTNLNHLRMQSTESP